MDRRAELTGRSAGGANVAPDADPGDFAAEEIESERRRELERETLRAKGKSGDEGKVKERDRKHEGKEPGETVRPRPPAGASGPRPNVRGPVKQQAMRPKPSAAETVHEVGPAEPEPAEPVSLRLGQWVRITATC